MISSKFVAEAISFKSDNSEDYTDRAFVVEVVEARKDGVVEIVFNLGAPRHYLKFRLDELIAAVKQFQKRQKK